MNLSRKVFIHLLSVLFTLTAIAQTKTADHRSDFVTRSGTSLQLASQPFRYSGPNIEWLGLEAYGPHDPQGPRYPTHFEIDDAFDTAKEMGARVVRSQTMGDSVGCDLCIEPQLGVFNPKAFDSIDYAIKAAHDRGMRLIITLIGDCATCYFGGAGQLMEWTHQADPTSFFTSPIVIDAYEKHVAAVLNHKNALTGIAYKDDPTILAWENCNMCGLGVVWLSPSKDFTPYLGWVDVIGRFIKSIDHKHLYLDTTGFFRFDKRALDAKTPDLITFEYYPHWDALVGGNEKTTAETFSRDAADVTQHGKVFIINEFGWDTTDWPTRDDLQKVLTTLETDRNISGDGFWALQAHNNNFGWQAIPANVSNPTYARYGESGQWWALYYGGIKTMINTADDMEARAQQLRTHAYKMAGESVPKHMVPPAPVLTTQGLGFIGWRGSAGAVAYTVQRKSTPSSEWETICDKCATDADSPWPDPKPAAGFNAKYRVIAYNAEGVASAPSAP
ncbi:MAG: cellulase family glycosylhydrolase [Candidatus Sulfotelmatobacter sp.]